MDWRLGEKKEIYINRYIVSCLTTGISSEPDLQSTFLSYKRKKTYGDVILHLLIQTIPVSLSLLGHSNVKGLKKGTSVTVHFHLPKLIKLQRF